MGSLLSAPAENLQPHITVKQAAKLMNVSERLVYMSRAVSRLRPDLDALVEAGDMSINEAHRIATKRTKVTRYDKLVRAWNAASEDDQGRFLVALSLSSRQAANA